MQNSGDEKTLIIIPTFKEEQNIVKLCHEIIALGGELHILFVDDNSPDRTQDRICEMMVKFPATVFLLARAGKMGLRSAYVAGFQWGMQRNYQRLVEMDADFSHSPRYLEPMLARLGTCDAVVGSRYVSGGGVHNWSVSRRLLSKGGSLYARLVLGMSICDLTGGFNAWTASVLQAVDLPSLRSDGYSFQIELKYRAWLRGFKISEVPIVFAEREKGQSKMSLAIVLEAIWKVWIFRFASKKQNALQSNNLP